MGKAFIKEETMTAIGNAIRAKTGETAAMLPSAMAGAITNIQTGGGSGSYVWTKQGMGESTTEDTTGGTYTLTTPNTTRPSTEIEYSTTAPTYNSTKRQWIFANPTVVTLSNADTTLPSISGNVYCRDMSEPNVWYLVSAFNKSSSSPYQKSMTYSKKITAPIDSNIEYVIDDEETNHPNGGWEDGCYYNLREFRHILGMKWLHANDLSLSKIYFYNSLFLGTSDYAMYYSADGKSWTRSNLLADSFTNFKVCHSEDLCVCVSDHYQSKGIYYSTDGKTWTKANNTSAGYISLC